MAAGTPPVDRQVSCRSPAAAFPLLRSLQSPVSSWHLELPDGCRKAGRLPGALRLHSTDTSGEAPLGGTTPPPPPPPPLQLQLDDRPDRRLPQHLQGKVVGHLFNAPWTALKHDVADFFSGCNLRPAAISTVIDEECRLMCWRLVFDSHADFQAAQRTVTERRRMGGRSLTLEAAPFEEMAKETNPRHVNRRAENERGRTLLMTNLEGDTPLRALYRFFEGFHLAPDPFTLMNFQHDDVRTPLRKRVKGEERPYISVVELRLLVKFATELEAQRALREKFGEFVGEIAVELKVIF